MVRNRGPSFVAQVIVLMSALALAASASSSRPTQSSTKQSLAAPPLALQVNGAILTEFYTDVGAQVPSTFSATDTINTKQEGPSCGASPLADVATSIPSNMDTGPPNFASLQNNANPGDRILNNGNPNGAINYVPLGSAENTTNITNASRTPYSMARCLNLELVAPATQT